MEAGSNLLVTCGGRLVGLVLQLKQAMSSVPPCREGRLLIADKAAYRPPAASPTAPWSYRRSSILNTSTTCWMPAASMASGSCCRPWIWIFDVWPLTPDGLRMPGRRWFAHPQRSSNCAWTRPVCGLRA